jgi:DNA-binding NarL/FixJ family response regulator
VIAEDEPLVAERIKVLLEDAGVRVVGVAADAGDAIELAERHFPTVAILDVKLAGAINGATLGDHLDVNYGLEIVFVTGDPMYACRHTSRRYQVLAKPFSDDELLKAVATACATAHGRATAVHQAAPGVA